MNSLSLLHMSDLHFGKNSRFQGRNLQRLGKMCAQVVMTGMENNFEKQGPDIVIVTGDITEQGLEEEFEQAAEFFNALQDSLHLSRSNFIFLPGNHDVSWEACKKYYKTYPDRKNKTHDRDLEREKLALFFDFMNHFYGEERPLTIAIEPGATLYVFENHRLCIAALNSCEPITHEAPIGAISEDQAQAVMDALLQDYNNYIKIAALHHPVNSDPEKVRAWIEMLRECVQIKELEPDLLTKFENDAVSVGGNEFITSILVDCHIHLLLHGHQHSYEELKQVKWRDRTEYCQICPTGSFGIKPDRLPADQPNCVRLINLFRDNNRLQLKSVTLQYDPLAREVGSVTSGCFRDFGRIDEASFPLDAENQLWTTWKEERSPTEPNDQIPPGIIQEKIEGILASAAGLRSALAKVFDKSDDPDELSLALAKMGFEEVWRKVVGRLGLFHAHLDTLKRVLLLLAQGAIKKETIITIQKKLASKGGNHVFSPPIRYPLMAELILKTAFETEIEVDFQTKEGGREITPRSMIPIPESGFDSNRKRDYIILQISRLFPDVQDLPEEERLENLKNRLEAYFISRQSYYVVHDDTSPINFPFISEFIIPSRKEPLPPGDVSNIAEAKLCELIKIILTTFDDLRKRGA